jgi:AMMECR1 domain-containing protein
VFPALARLAILWHLQIMKSTINSAKKSKRGRPPVDTEAVNVRMAVDVLKFIDDWRRKQDDLPGRPEAIRRLVDLGLKAKQK